MNLDMLMPDFGILIPQTIACMVILSAPILMALWTVGAMWTQDVLRPSGRLLIFNVSLAIILVTIMLVTNIGTIYKVVEAAYWGVMIIFLGFALAICGRAVTHQCSYVIRSIRHPRRTRD